MMYLYYHYIHWFLDACMHSFRNDIFSILRNKREYFPQQKWHLMQEEHQLGDGDLPVEPTWPEVIYGLSRGKLREDGYFTIIFFMIIRKSDNSILQRQASENPGSNWPLLENWGVKKTLNEFWADTWILLFRGKWWNKEVNIHKIHVHWLTIGWYSC